MTVEQLRFGGQQDFETIVSAAVKRHREEELQLIKDNLAKIVSDLKSDAPNSMISTFVYSSVTKVTGHGRKPCYWTLAKADLPEFFIHLGFKEVHRIDIYC